MKFFIFVRKGTMTISSKKLLYGHHPVGIISSSEPHKAAEKYAKRKGYTLK